MIRRLRNAAIRLLIACLKQKVPRLPDPRDLETDPRFLHYVDSISVHPEDRLVAIRGWAFSPELPAVTAIRAHNGTKAFPGAYGFERADVAAHFKTGPEGLHSGFAIHIPSAVVPPEKTDDSWALELMDSKGFWHCFAKSSLAAGNKGQ